MDYGSRFSARAGTHHISSGVLRWSPVGCFILSWATSAHALVSKYLSDPTEDVRVATENILADFLREIRHVTTVRKRAEEQAKSRRDVDLADKDQSPPGEEKEKLDDASQSVFLSDVSTRVNQYDSSSMYKDDYNSEVDIRDTGGMPYFFTWSLFLLSWLYDSLGAWAGCPY